MSLSSQDKLAAALDAAETPPPQPQLLRTISGKKHIAVPGVDDVQPNEAPTGPDGVEPPDLLRGYSRVDRTEELLARLVADAMKSKGWGDVDVSTIVVTDKSGGGGSQTYKVTAEGVLPTAVALHSRSENVANDELSDPRMEAAAMVLSNHGFAPRRLAYGGDWFIEEWEGVGQPEFNSKEKAKEVGEFLANFHKVPTDWFDRWRERLIERFAKTFPEANEAGDGLNQVPLGSFIWWFTCRKEWIEEMDAGTRAKWFKEDCFAPATVAGQRLVTTHGDLHPGNTIETAAGIKAIDLEFTHVTHAASDLGYAMNEFKHEFKRDFLEAYLVASGFPAKATDVDALFLDASFHSLGYHWGHMAAWRYDPEMAHIYKMGIAKIRADPTAFLQSDNDFFEYVEKIPDVKAAKAVAEMAINDKVWADLVPLPNLETKDEPMAKLDWHGSKTFKCETSQFSFTCWFYLHPHQRYTQRGMLISTGYTHSRHRNGGRPGHFFVGWRRSSEKGPLSFVMQLHGNTEDPNNELEPDDSALVDSQWHHLAVVYSVSEKAMSLYVDGAFRRKVSYLCARPMRIPDVVAIGGSPYFGVPLEPYKNRAATDKLILIRVTGHPTEEYNGVYAQVENTTCDSLHCGLPFFKNKNDRYLKKYNAEAGGGPDWSFDHRPPDVTKDWCDGGWYLSGPENVLKLGSYKWDNSDKIIISWAELEPEKVGDASAELAALPPEGYENGILCFDCTSGGSDFPKGQIWGSTLFSRCLSGEEVAQLYAKESAEDKPKPTEAPSPVALEKISLERTLTWQGHVDKAQQLDAKLPTLEDIVLSGINDGDVDHWIPVIRGDGADNDWVQIGTKEHPLYISHSDSYDKAGWGKDDNDAEWRPKYFFVKR